MENQSANVTSEFTAILRAWEDEHSEPSYNPVPTLTRLAEIIEIEIENYIKMDPDPFDERHPSRADPDCKFGQILKILFKKDNFMNRLVSDYLRDSYFTRLALVGRDVDELNIAACRLMLNIMPGLETSVVFQPYMDHLVQRLIKWATDSPEPLQSYATGLLAAAMELPEIATKFREQNLKLVPLLLQRLRQLQTSSDFISSNNGCFIRPFAHLSGEKGETNNKKNELDAVSPSKKRALMISNNETIETDSFSDSGLKTNRKFNAVSPKYTADNMSVKGNLFSEASNSSWAELETLVIGSVNIYPLNNVIKQCLILRYLTPLGEYQEFLSHVFEQNALELILCYVNVRETKEARLAFEALRYLASLLCHKKFCIEFMQSKGLEALLDVPRPSIAATGVSLCLYYLGYCVEAMERVCLQPTYILTKLVKYALWLLECSHDSGRCHATMFFGLTFQFKVILDEFDAQDGLRKLHNVISTLPILSSEDNADNLNEDAECAARQIVRHVCVTLKRYLEAHLYSKVEQLRQAQIIKINERIFSQSSGSCNRVHKSSPELVQEQTETLLELMPYRAHWPPVDQLLKLGGITLLLKIIAFAYEWNYSGRAETVRCALDVLAIACIMPKVQLLFCERIDLPEDTITVGINIILGAADGEIVGDADVQKAALRVIVNCVCAPINRIGGNAAARLNASPTKKVKGNSSEELIQKVWESVRANSGIMVLLQLMNVKTPITDADSIRTLACKALAGLARSETVRQILSKLPIFTNGELQNLIRDPILQEKRLEHVSFQKYALELLERLSGKTKQTNNDFSLINIYKANVVAQTKIQFNDRQLLQLIYQHLISKGLVDSATLLQKEANLNMVANNMHLPAKFRYVTPVTPNRTRFASTSSSYHRTPSNVSLELSPTITSIPNSPVVINGNITPSSQTIKLIKKAAPQPQTSTTPSTSNSRLQKQISAELTKKLLPGPEEKEKELEPRITLESIITEYLTNQHALCKNPMATCPQFNLFEPHKCPDPKSRPIMANNFVIRHARRSLGYQCESLKRRLIHTRFCPVQTIRLPTEEGFFTCAKFSPNGQNIIAGDYSGEVRIFNIYTGNEEAMFQAHDNYIVHIEPSVDGSLILTSSTWGRPLSAVWSVHSNYSLKYPIEVEDYVEFSKINQDKILGTKGETASIYDTATGTLISRLIPKIHNQYTKNKATFSPNDDLVLSDGVLFDVRSSTPIHKLDKLNQTQSGVFHPNGLEIVSNTEVWDIRTFHLLKTVPVLNQCQALFSPINSAVYATAIEQDLEDDTTLDSSFKTIDACDYSSIGTFNVKRKIYDLAVNKYDSQIAIVENQGMYQTVQESVVRIYDVGRTRDDEEAEQEEDDEEDMDGSDDDDSNDGGGVLMDVVTGDNAGGNNDNNDNEDGDDDSDDESWSEISEDSLDSFGMDSSDTIDDMIFEM